MILGCGICTQLSNSQYKNLHICTQFCQMFSWNKVGCTLRTQLFLNKCVGLRFRIPPYVRMHFIPYVDYTEYSFRRSYGEVFAHFIFYCEPYSQTRLFYDLKKQVKKLPQWYKKAKAICITFIRSFLCLIKFF